MAGASKTFDKVTSEKNVKERFGAWDITKPKSFEKSVINPVHMAKEVAGDLGGVFTPDIPEPEEDTILPIGDPNVAQTRARKKRAKAKTSGRSSTILTEGLGG